MSLDIYTPLVNATRRALKSSSMYGRTAAGAWMPFLVGTDGGIATDASSGLGASGKTPVTGTFTATGQSSSFIPLAGRGFNVTIRGTFVASVQLERAFGDANWVQAAAARTAPDTFICDEDEATVSYRLNCTAFTSGTVTYRISQ